MTRHGWSLVWLGTLGALLAPTARSEPFPVRNQHPLAALYGLPAPLPARLPAAGTGTLGATVGWTSFEATDSTGDRTYTLDGEVFEARVLADRALGEDFALHVEVAYRSLSEGSLDSFIDDWHGAFGLPGGSRHLLPENELLLEYRAGEAAIWRLDSSTSGIADLPVALGYALVATETSAASAWLSVKLPTGSADDLTGSGAPDVALSVAAQTRPGSRWEWFGQANVAWLGEGDFLPRLQQEFAWSVLGGVTWNAWRGLDLTAQVEANSALLDTGLSDLDGDAAVLTFGGSYETQRGWRFDLGIVEDIEADAAPDVTFLLGLRRTF
jgi:hypothetical protein